jgi:hypothetical protein
MVYRYFIHFKYLNRKDYVSEHSSIYEFTHQMSTPEGFQAVRNSLRDAYGRGITITNYRFVGQDHTVGDV